MPTDLTRTLSALRPIPSVSPIAQRTSLAGLQNLQNSGQIQQQSIQENQMALQQKQASAQKQQQIAGILQQPGAIGPDGVPSKEAIAAISQVDPDHAAALQKAFGLDANTQSEISTREETRKTAADTLAETVKQHGIENDREAAKPKSIDPNSPEGIAAAIAKSQGEYHAPIAPRNIDPLSPEGIKATIDVKTAESKLKPANEDPRLSNVDPKDYTEAKKEAFKIENAYVAAQRASDDLSTFTKSAKGGNRVSAAYSPVEAVLQINAGAGVKRINRQEIDQMAGAGSLFDHIAGWAGKQTEGQPIPANILADMDSLSQLLGGNAKTQRDRGLQAVDKIYNSKFANESASPSPAGPAIPKVGEVRGGYKFKGGDPAKQENWIKQ